MGKKITNFFELDAWREAHKLVLAVYAITNSFPRKETYVLTAQMLRAVISITSNIAEGFGRRGLKEKIQFYSIAKASLTELQNQLIICRDLGYCTKKKFNEVWSQSVTAHKLINGLIRSLKKI
ncbi:MAG: four helix bundle protein [Patescibacteria group bacterium]